LRMISAPFGSNVPQKLSKKVDANIDAYQT
jgi:hypothetical protein